MEEGAAPPDDRSAVLLPALGQRSAAITEEPIASLRDYASVPIAFEVASILEVNDDHGPFRWTERLVDARWTKDYDAIPGEHPSEWPERFDVSRWGVLSARVDGRRVGGAVIAFDTPGVEMLEGRRDLAVLWDIRVAPEARGNGVGAALFRAAEEWARGRGCRVAPEARGNGVGAALFRAAEEWARGRGCRQLKVETQNVNVAACRFYERQGCVLTAVDPVAYPSLPSEIQLLWYKDLAPAEDDR